MKISKMKFGAWLADKKAGEIVGERWSSRNGPLVNYIKTLMPVGTKVAIGASHPRSLDDVIIIDNKQFKMVPWVRRFFYDIDGIAPRKITAGAALTFLKGF